MGIAIRASIPMGQPKAQHENLVTCLRPVCSTFSSTLQILVTYLGLLHLLILLGLKPLSQVHARTFAFIDTTQGLKAGL